MKIVQESMFLCREYVQDAESDLVSAFSLIDGFEVDDFPSTVGPIAFVAKFVITNSGSNDTEKLTLSIIDPDSKVTSPSPREFDLPLFPKEKFTKSGMLLRLPEIVARSEGVYKIIAKHNNVKVGEFGFTIYKSSNE
jgi:hypothetical protein